MSDQNPPGISAFDFEDLPPGALSVVRVLLRHPGSSLEQLRSLLEPAAPPELPALLDTLVQSRVLGHDAAGGYHVQLRRTLSASAPALWDTVAPRRRTGLLDLLDLENLPPRHPPGDPPPDDDAAR